MNSGADVFQIPYLRVFLINSLVRNLRRDVSESYSVAIKSVSLSFKGNDWSGIERSWLKNSSQTRKKSACVLTRRIWCKHSPSGSTTTPHDIMYFFMLLTC